MKKLYIIPLVFILFSCGKENVDIGKIDNEQNNGNIVIESTEQNDFVNEDEVVDGALDSENNEVDSLSGTQDSVNENLVESMDDGIQKELEKEEMEVEVIMSEDKQSIKFGDIIYKIEDEKSIVKIMHNGKKEVLYSITKEETPYFKIKKFYNLSPSGNILTFHYQPQGDPHVFSIQTESKEVLWKKSCNLQDIIWSSDRKQVAITCSLYDTFNVYISEKGNVRNLKNEFTSNYCAESLSTDYFWEGDSKFIVDIKYPEGINTEICFSGRKEIITR